MSSTTRTSSRSSRAPTRSGWSGTVPSTRGWRSRPTVTACACGSRSSRSRRALEWLPSAAADASMPVDRVFGVMSLVGGFACLAIGLTPRAHGPPEELRRWPVPAMPAPPPPPPPKFVDELDVTEFQKGNIHAHSRWSDGDSHPDVLYEWYRSHGYRWLALTDHNKLTD